MLEIKSAKWAFKNSNLTEYSPIKHKVQGCSPDLYKPGVTEHPYNSSISDVEARGTVKNLIKDTPCWGRGEWEETREGELGLACNR